MGLPLWHITIRRNIHMATEQDGWITVFPKIAQTPTPLQKEILRISRISQVDELVTELNKLVKTFPKPLE
jgi:hypothetical protein